MKSEYLIFNGIIVLFPLIAKLLYKKSLLPRFYSALGAISIAAVPFLLFDNLVTGYFWSFNLRYILGLRIGSLPVEEMLFFFTVPFSCLFLWVNWKQMFERRKNTIYRATPYIILAFSLLGAIYLSVLGKYYTASVFCMMVLMVLIDIRLKTKLFTQGVFLVYLCTINAFTLVFNFYLTARPIVLYEGIYKVGLMVLTIPIEDFIFGIALISLVIMLYEKFAH